VVPPTRSVSLGTEELLFDKLIIAMGLTSKPALPKIDASAFKGRIPYSTQKTLANNTPF
jgi:cation diffusion facilitator CzcD-associated flavoprotein CzcO